MAKKALPAAFLKNTSKNKIEVPSGGLKKGAKPCTVCKGSHVPPHPHFTKK